MRDTIKKILKESDFDWISGTDDLPFEIGERIPPKDTPKNTIKMKVEWMHGDADGYTNDKFSFNMDKPKQRERFLLLIKAINAYRYSDEYIDGWGELKRCFVKAGMSKDEAESMRYEWESDMQSDGEFPAHPSIERITYFDNEGIERKVKMKK